MCTGTVCGDSEGLAESASPATLALNPHIGGHDAELDHYDVVIIGSGAGGDTLAWKLAPSGKRILLLERGPYLRRERDNWETSAVFVRAKYHCTEEWLDEDGNEFSPEQNYYVGGNTKFYEAALFRLVEWHAAFVVWS